MKFYNREKENNIAGRNRTQLANVWTNDIYSRQATYRKNRIDENGVQEKKILYLFVEKKNEALPCEEFTQEIRYRNAVEIGNFDHVHNIVERDYETYSRLILERYFRTEFIESEQFPNIVSCRDRKGKNEIGIVAVNYADKRLVFYEVKRNAGEINFGLFEKNGGIVGQYPDYMVEYIGFSPDGM